jgi:K+-sensing histidine kinase KdpD
LAALITSDTKQLSRLVKKTRQRYKKELKNSNELKANNSSKEIREHILKKINKLTDIKIFFMVLDKTRMKSLYLKNNKHKQYNFVAGKLASYLPLKEQEVKIVIDRSKGRQLLEQDFNNYFKTKLETKNKPNKLSISHSYSQNWAGLQIVDFIAWSAFQKFERNNNEFIDIIKIEKEAFFVF